MHLDGQASGRVRFQAEALRPPQAVRPERLAVVNKHTSPQQVRVSAAEYLHLPARPSGGSDTTLVRSDYRYSSIAEHHVDGQSTLDHFLMALHSYIPIPEEKIPVDVTAAEYPIRRSTPSVRQRLIGHFLPAVLLTSALLLLIRSTFVCHGRYNPSKELNWPSNSAQDVVEREKVALEAHIMSKCPDARDCLQQLVVPTMEQVSDKVDFRISYIGR